MKDRLSEFMRIKEMSAGRIAEMIGVQPSAISHILSGRNKPGFDLLSNIFRRFPDLSPKWLMLGEGKMFTTDIGHRNEGARPSITIAEDLPEVSERSHPSKTTTPHDNYNKNNDGESIESNKKIDRIIIFYSDGSFSSYENQDNRQ